MKRIRKSAPPNKRTSICQAGNQLYYSVQRAAKELGVWYQSLYRKVLANEVKTTKINGQRYFSELTIARMKREKAVRIVGSDGTEILVARDRNLKRLMSSFGSGTFEIVDLPPETPAVFEFWIWENGELMAEIADNAVLLAGWIPPKMVKFLVLPEYYLEFSQQFLEVSDKDEFVNAWIAKGSNPVVKG